MIEFWIIDVCLKCNKPHQAANRYTSCITEFDPAGDTLAGTRQVKVFSFPPDVPYTIDGLVHRLAEAIVERDNTINELKQKALYAKESS
jgi:hypothetical protein